MEAEIGALIQNYTWSLVDLVKSMSGLRTWSLVNEFSGLREDLMAMFNKEKQCLVCTGHLTGQRNLL